jgi:hypothetical protein
VKLLGDGHTARRSASALACSLLLLCSWPTHADERGYFGLLRARDLTPFGFLRLDMRPAHAVSAPAGTWAIETELAYQNTWALSPETEEYLDSLPGRRELGPAEVQAIRDLPGENYLYDLELAELDVTFHYKFAEHWGGYLILSGVSYRGGFLDSAIEGFHDTFGFSSFGRPAVARDDVNVILDLKSSQVVALEAPTDGGMLDPTIGLRYSGIGSVMGWDLVVEAAVKVPVDGERNLLSTGDFDYGMQATFQRFSDHHAWYMSLSGVYYDGTNSITPTPAQIIPTLVLGYERRMTPKTHLLIQGYASPSIYSDDETDLDELTIGKFQLSLGVYHRIGGGLLSFGITENFQNINNTPDIGFQLGYSFSPALRTVDTP